MVLANVVDIANAPRFNTLPYFLVDATGAPVLNNGQLIPLIGTTGAGTSGR